MPITSRNLGRTEPTEYLAQSGTAAARYVDIFKFIPATTFYRSVQGRINNIANTGLPGGMAVSHNGQWLAVAQNSSPWILMFQRVGDNWVKISNPSIPFTSYAYGISWSLDDSVLFACPGATPFLGAFLRTGSNFAPLSPTSGIVLNQAYDSAWNSTGTMVVMGGSTNTVTLKALSFNTVTNVFANITTVPSLPTGQTGVRSLGFNSATNKLAVSYMGPNTSTVIYNVTNQIFTTSSYLARASSTIYSTRFNPRNDNLLATSAATAPVLSIYTLTGAVYTTTNISIDIQPSGLGYTAEWSSDGQYIAVGTDTYPYLYTYQADSSGQTYTQLSTASIATLPGGAVQKVSWVTTPNQPPNHSRLGVYYNAIPYYQEYAVNGTTMTSLATVIDYNPLTAPTNNGTNQAKMSPNGNYFAGVGGVSPFWFFYARTPGTDQFTTATIPNLSASGQRLAFSPDSSIVYTGGGTPATYAFYSISGVGTSTTLTKITTPMTAPSATSYCLSGTWNLTTNTFVVTSDSTPFYTNYTYTGTGLTTTFTKVTTIASTIPTGQIGTAAYSPDGTLIVMGGSVSPYLWIYTCTNGLFSLTGTNITSFPGTSIYDTAWTPDSQYLATAQAASPYIKVYARTNGTTFTPLSNPSTLPSAAPGNIAWNYDGTKLFVQFTSSLYTYQRTGGVLSLLTATITDFTLQSGSGVGYAAIT